MDEFDFRFEGHEPFFDWAAEVPQIEGLYSDPNNMLGPMRVPSGAILVVPLTVTAHQPHCQEYADLLELALNAKYEGRI